MFLPSLSRRFYLHLCVALAAGSLGMTTRAAESSADPKTLLAERGKLLFSDDLNAAPAKEWHVAKGKWEVVDGAWHAEELPADNHPGVVRRPFKFQDAIFQYSFKLEGTKMTTSASTTRRGISAGC
ncbi:MAG: hypothetical protein WDN28_29795 [Chthoniobacter sp.]